MCFLSHILAPVKVPERLTLEPDSLGFNLGSAIYQQEALVVNYFNSLHLHFLSCKLVEEQFLSHRLLWE